MQGEGNHQYGLIGDKNASFRGEEIDSEYGYVLVYCPDHPFPHDKSVRGSRGRIVGVTKSGKIGEGCDANPESNSEIAKGSERCNA